MDESFLGNALNGIDGKNRLSVPSSFRDVIAARSDARAIVLCPAERADCLMGFDPGYPTKVRAELEARFAGDFSETRDDRWRNTFGSVEKFTIDDNGRIVLSPAIKEAGEFDKLALFWGMGDYFEIWNPHRFVERPGLDPRVVRMVRRLLEARGEA